MPARNKTKHFPLLDLPPELVEKVVATLGPEDQVAKKAARATCTQLRSAVNAAVSSVTVHSYIPVMGVILRCTHDTNEEG
jgi:hypothetical protein